MTVELPEDSKPVFASEDKTRIDCDVLHEGKRVRFTAGLNDPVDYSRRIYATLMLDPSKIAPYPQDKE